MNARSAYAGYVKRRRRESVGIDRESHSRLAQFQWACVFGSVHLEWGADGERKGCHTRPSHTGPKGVNCRCALAVSLQSNVVPEC